MVFLILKIFLCKILFFFSIPVFASFYYYENESNAKNIQGRYLFSKSCNVINNLTSQKTIYNVREGQELKILQYREKYVQVLINDNNETGWVEKDCGSFFIYNSNSNLDIPQFNENNFDRTVLDICGSWGSSVNQKKFKESFKLNVSGTIKKNFFLIMKCDNDSSDCLANLVNIWFNANGFQNIFCGYFLDNILYGPRFHGRYFEMKNKKWAWKTTEKDCANSDTKENVVSFFYANTNGLSNLKCLYSYNPDLSAEDTMNIGIFAQDQYKKKKEKDGYCYLKYKNKIYYVGFVGDAIKDLYESSYWQCSGSKKNTSCFCSEKN